MQEPFPQNKEETSTEQIVETKLQERQKPAEVITARGSVYRYLSDGRTQRFKTATGELHEPQDTLVFIC